MAGKGSPKGNKYAETHGIVTLRNLIKRRTRKGRSLTAGLTPGRTR
jgi:hypothetical protein